MLTRRHGPIANPACKTRFDNIAVEPERITRGEAAPRSGVGALGERPMTDDVRNAGLPGAAAQGARQELKVQAGSDQGASMLPHVT